MATGTTTCARDISISESVSFGSSSSIGAVAEGLYLGRVGELDYTDESLLSDDGSSITATYRTRDIDCGDLDPTYKDLFKTLVKVRLEYVDITTDTDITIMASVDGGYSWKTKTETIGSATGQTATADFDFLNQTGITGKMFTFKIINVSTDEETHWLGLDIFFRPMGEYFEVS